VWWAGSGGASRMAQRCGKRRFSLQKQSAKWLKIWQIFTFLTCSIAAPRRLRLRLALVIFGWRFKRLADMTIATDDLRGFLNSRHISERIYVDCRQK
jgi:hypothetical protein